METLHHFIDFFLHLDHHLNAIVEQYGTFTYVIIFLIIFCETGLVITPFLPGDSLLFALGALAASGDVLDIKWMILLLTTAAILGDTVNYWIGNIIGPRVFTDNIKFLKKEHLNRTHMFFEKYGGKTIILARFIPIIRTFAPFLAGVGSMSYRKFLLYNVVGGIFWVFSFSLLGYFFGNLPIVEKNFSLVILAIIVLSILPAVYEYFKHKSEI